MREVNNNPTGNHPNFKQPKVDKTANADTVAAAITGEETKDAKKTDALFDDPAMKALIKSDTTDEDIAFMLDNPKSVETADMLFDRLYNHFVKQGMENPYEEATRLSNAFVR